MPNIIELDSTIREENPTIILGKSILIKIVENPNKQEVLRNRLVKRLVSIPDLCNDDMRQLIENLLNREACLSAPAFVQALMKHKAKFEESMAAMQWFTQAFAPIMKSKMTKAFEKSVHKSLKDDEKLLKQEDLRADLFLRVKGQINKKNLQKLEKEIISIDKNIERKSGFRLTEPSVLFVCSKCKSILYENEISTKKCLSCNRKITEESVQRIPIVKVPLEIRQVWQSNLWFEAYFAHLLQKLRFKTWTGIHVMGTSGIQHEVDVLAIKNGTVIMSECKTGKVSRNDVFNFCTKLGDVKTHVSILALIKDLPEPETREFVRKNLSIITIENMGKMKEADILAYLKQRLPT